MGVYRKIDTRIQNDERILDLSQHGRLAWYDLYSSERLNSFGAMRTSLDGLSYDMASLKWDPKAFVKALQESIDNGLVEYDSALLLWYPRYLRYNAPATFNVMKSWPRLLDSLPPCQLRNSIITALIEYIEKSNFNDDKRPLIQDLQKGVSKDVQKGVSKEPLISISIRNKYKSKEELADFKNGIPYYAILDSLNSITGKSFRSGAKFRELVRARWNEGHREPDFEKVIRTKTNHWKGTEQEQYLRPETLFGTKFDGYRNQPEKLPGKSSISDIGDFSDPDGAY